MRGPLLGLYGGADEGIPPEHIEAFEQGLAKAGVDHEIVIYPGAPHSFFDRRFEEHADACGDAWRRARVPAAGLAQDTSEASRLPQASTAASPWRAVRVGVAHGVNPAVKEVETPDAAVGLIAPAE